MSYLIQISEQQRAIILAALDVSLNRDPAPASFDGSTADEPYVLRELFHTLPDAEAEQVAVHGCAPGESVHGFTL